MLLNKLLNKGYQADHCQLCQTQFNLIKFQRIHKCKRCQKYICKECGKDKQKIIDQDGVWTKQSHRICKLCKVDFQQIHQTIIKVRVNKTFRMICNGTKIQVWQIHGYQICKLLKILSKNKKLKQIDYQYEHFLKLFLSNIKNHSEEAQIIDKDVVKGRTDSSVFNFSMREFFYTVKADVQNKASRNNIKNVLYALAARYDKIGYCQGMSGVAAFLLCFSSEKMAFTLFCDLLQNVYPADFFLKSQFGISLSGLLAESYFLQQYFIHYVTKIKKPLLIKIRGQFYEQSQLLFFRTIIELVSSKALLSLFVGILSFSNCIFIWQEIKQYRTIEVIQKAFIAMIYLNRQKILEHRSFKIIEEIFERMNLDQFKQFYYDVEIDQNFRKQKLEQYYEEVKKKWNTNTKEDQQLKTLEKLTMFTQRQLNLLQNLFPVKGQICIVQEEFVKLIEIYYKILKQDYPKDIVLQVKAQFVKKIFESFKSNNKQGLDFREFVLCLSICTQSKVKDRIRVISSTFRDEKNLIRFENFQMLIKTLSQISENRVFKQKREQFQKRMEKYFSQQSKIHLKEIEILLNDDFLNDLSLLVRSSTPKIIEKMIQVYKIG